jgi:hypothetical protein
MPAALYGEEQTLIVAREVDRSADVRDSCGLHNNRGALVEGWIEDASRIVVAAFSREKQASTQLAFEVREHLRRERHALTVARNGFDILEESAIAVGDCGEERPARDREGYRGRCGDCGLEESPSPHKNLDFREGEKAPQRYGSFAAAATSLVRVVRF